MGEWSGFVILQWKRRFYDRFVVCRAAPGRAGSLGHPVHLVCDGLGGGIGLFLQDRQPKGPGWHARVCRWGHDRGQLLVSACAGDRDGRRGGWDRLAACHRRVPARRGVSLVGRPALAAPAHRTAYGGGRGHQDELAAQHSLGAGDHLAQHSRGVGGRRGVWRLGGGLAGRDVGGRGGPGIGHWHPKLSRRHGGFRSAAPRGNADPQELLVWAVVRGRRADRGRARRGSRDLDEAHSCPMRWLLRRGQ